MKERGFICQNCHMPEIERPVATGGPIRWGRQHLWRGGHDPEMVKRAVGIKVVAEPAEPKPGDKVQVTLTLINAGQGINSQRETPIGTLPWSLLSRIRTNRYWKDSRIPWVDGSCGSRQLLNCTTIA